MFLVQKTTWVAKFDTVYTHLRCCLFFEMWPNILFYYFCFAFRGLVYSSGCRHPRERLKPKTFYTVLPNIRRVPGRLVILFVVFFWLPQSCTTNWHHDIAELDDFSLSLTLSFSNRIMPDENCNQKSFRDDILLQYAPGDLALFSYWYTYTIFERCQIFGRPIISEKLYRNNIFYYMAVLVLFFF